MLSLGQRLRQQREQRKLSLDGIAKQTKISTRYLQAIETENLHELPSGLFRRSFIQQYAEALGIDFASLEPELNELFGTVETGGPPAAVPEILTARAITVEPLPAALGSGSGRRLIWGFGLLIFAITACTGVYALWQRTQKGPAQSRQESTTPPPAADAYRVKLETTAVETGTKPEVEISEQPLADARGSKQALADARGSKQALADTRGSEQVLAVTRAAEKAIPSRDRARAVKTRKMSFHLAATERTWVWVSSNGKTLFSGTLEPNQTKTLEGNGRTRVLVRNAGGLEVQVNGKPVGPLGAPGQVRVLELTPENYQTVSP